MTSTTIPSAADIREARLNAGLSQEQFARLLGCSVRAVMAWEQEINQPAGLYLKALTRLIRRLEREKGTSP